MHIPRDVPESARLPELPSTWARTGLNKKAYASLLTRALPLLARYGSHTAPELLEQLADAAGVVASCPLVRDPHLLLDEGLRFAFRQIWPHSSVGGESSAGGERIPVDALRIFVIESYRRFQANAESVRLITSANLFGGSDLHVRPGVLEESPVVLELDRLLMRGQDAGAFREGVSAEDLYIVIISLCSFPVTSGSTFHTLYGMNATDEQNSAGLENLVADAVVAFLTTSMPTSQGNSYTHFSQSVAVGPSVAASLYSSEAADHTVDPSVVATSTWPVDQVYGND